MQRYFVDENTNQLSQDDIFHMLKVMRFEIGDRFELVKDKKVFIMEIERISPFSYKIIAQKDIVNNDYHIVLLYCLPKGDKMDLVLQKATELGVNEIVGLISSRTIVRLDSKDREKKLIRYNKIIKEASEQCHRDDVPLIRGIYDYKSLKDFTYDYCYIAYEDEAGNTNKFYQELSRIPKGSSIAILVGAEGGFSEEEVIYAESLGYKRISLGKRILRSETAAISSLAIISFMLERD